MVTHVLHLTTHVSPLIDDSEWFGHRRRMREKTKQLGIRVPESLIRRLDLYAQKMSEQMPGLKFTRADAVRVLLERGLAETGVMASLGEDRSKEEP